MMEFVDDGCADRECAVLQAAVTHADEYGAGVLDAGAGTSVAAFLMHRFGRIGCLVLLTLSWDAVVRWLNCFAIGSSTLLMDGAPGSQALVHHKQLDWPMTIWNSTSVDAEYLQNAGCWQHKDSLLKGEVELLKLLLKPSRLQILVAAIRIPTLWLQHDAEELTAVGVRLLASLLVFCIWCGRSGACAVPYLELC
ncbi:hypothetical protein Nepgr_024782 [Nepenthes gracilis]|uniref:Uncharacterized protein n=1 Tax=Nepenthes gracilis TaxID=150966 RepID=A0AAD3T5R9_NEPGR|nr:hypothetical protein Nepgr_024782 [Nepenthes gracilis]